MFTEIINTINSLPSEGVAAICSAIAACAAAVGTWIQAHSASVQNRNSVKPVITTSMTTDDEKQKLYLTLRNVGLGPALVEEYVVFVNGKAYSSSECVAPLQIALAGIYQKFGQKGVIYAATVRNNSALKAGHDVHIVRLPIILGSKHAHELFDFLRTIEIKFKYRSLNGERSTYRYRYGKNDYQKNGVILKKINKLIRKLPIISRLAKPQKPPSASATDHPPSPPAR